MDMLPVGISKKYTNKRINEIIDDDGNLMAAEVLEALAKAMGYVNDDEDSTVNIEGFKADLGSALNPSEDLTVIYEALNEIEGGE